MDVGLELRQARERRGVSLQQISNTTKVSLRVLQAIEAADLSRLPEPVFTRSFVKAFAREVGLDPEDVVRRYFEQFAPPEVPPDAVEPEPAPPLPLPSRAGTPIVLVLVVLAIAALAVRNYRHANADATQAATATPQAGTGEVVPAAAPPSPPVGTSGTAPPAPDRLRLAIAPTGPCWVRATVDGQSVLAALLAAGDRREIAAPSDVTLRIGDPAACALSINGAPAHVPGTAGQAVTVHVTKENYRTFLTR